LKLAKHKKGEKLLLPSNLLSYRQKQGQIFPTFLDQSDYPWIEEIIETYISFHGESKRRAQEKLYYFLQSDSLPTMKVKMFLFVVDRIWLDQCRAKISPQLIRKQVFLNSAQQQMEPTTNYPQWRNMIFHKVAKELQINPKQVEELLFSDLPNERVLVTPQALPSSADLALKTNLALVQGILLHTEEIGIQILGNARAVVRHAKLKGLICTIEPSTNYQSYHDTAVMLKISGPFSLFRKTRLYGRILGEIIPMLGWCKAYELKANCFMKNPCGELILRSGSPIIPSKLPKKYDSKLEQKFSRSFIKIAPDWEIIREPKPLTIGNSFIFPDFALNHKLNPNRQWLLEIIGFWTAEYLEQKLLKLQTLNIKNLIICLNDKLNCKDEELPNNSRIIRYKYTIDPRKVLSIINEDRP